ncbi:putative Isoamyl acetate-hydrolyzing esterase 1-like protein [Hypsibius exemplaris]|uniref:Isoamyl acetate-hydrolyzing esterase 1-like protein n=1 Tax=Hypsibius exemplaris TaxID=2072580 RepID=A0A1W0WKA9_HYPEX|nr:putative Isoamyl acetate-hydrolyzing esterase 1-like protein [Hypsibius exemplaris]
MISNWPQLILFGDSHFQFCFGTPGSFGSRLADKLQRRCDVLNRGFSGYNTVLAKQLLPEIFQGESLRDVVGVVILFGTNDAALEEPHQRSQRVSLEDYAQNLADIIAHFVANGVPKERIILVSPPPADDVAWEMNQRLRNEHSPRSNAEIEKYAQVVYEVARIHGTLFGNLHESILNSSDKWQVNYADGLHFNDAGSAVFFELLSPIVDRMLRAYPARYPLWTEIDFSNPSIKQ